MFKFHEGAVVALREPLLGLDAGETGTVWALYETQPPSYEVTFCDAGGTEFDATVTEEELSDPVTSREALSATPARVRRA